MSFKDSVTKYRSVYFHFLDGLLNSTTGGETKDVLSTLDDISSGLLPSNINFVNLEYQDDGYIIFRQLNNKITTNFFTEYNNDFKSFLPDMLNNMNYYLLQNYFDFLLIPIGFNSHITTAIIFKKNTSLYLFILNTGLDIQENGPQQIINGQTLSQLCKGICICYNIRDINELKRTCLLIYNFFFIGYFYDFIEKNKYSLIKDDSYIFNPNLKKKLEYFKIIFNNNLTTEIFTLKFSNKNQNITIDELIILIDDPNLKFDEKFLKLKLNYYTFVSKFIDFNLAKVNIGRLATINHFNETSLLSLNSRFSEIFLKKIILYNQNDNLYIYDQESASCSWYSIYFSILLYFVIYDNKKYIPFINGINNHFFEYLKKIYTNENFKIEFKEKKEMYKDNYYNYMLKLCSKLIDINLFDRKILYDQQDIIYNTDIDFNFNLITDDKDHLTRNFYDEDNLKIIKKILDKYYGDKYELYLTAYLIYANKKNFFKSNIDINYILEQLKTYIFEIDIENKNYLLKILSSYILIFDNTYKLTFDMNNCPSFISYFIPIVLYVNDNSNLLKPLELDFDQNKTNLFECSLIFFRFYLIVQIINILLTYIKNSQQFNYLIRQTVLELINVDITGELELKKKKELDFVIEEDNLELNNFIMIEKKILEPVIFDSFDEKFNNFLEIEKILYQNFNLISTRFLILNINRINKNSELKTKLIKFYCKIIYNYKNEKEDEYEEIDDKLENLYVLLFNFIEHTGISNTKNKNNIPLYIFTSQIYELKKNKKLSYDDFETNIVNNILFEKFSIIPNYNIKNVTIDDVEFEKADIASSLFNDIVLITKERQIKKIFSIYEIKDNNYIKYNCIFLTKIDQFKVLEIFFNGYSVLKFNSIIYPFKYLIPITDSYFIYNKNGVYNVAFLCDVKYKWLYNRNNFDDKYMLLGNRNLYHNIYNFEINPNTQFFLNKFSSDETSNF